MKQVREENTYQKVEYSLSLSKEALYIHLGEVKTYKYKIQKSKPISDNVKNVHSLVWFPHIIANTALHFL